MKVISKFSRRLIVCLFTSGAIAAVAVASAATNNSPPGTKLWEFEAGFALAPPAVGPDGTVYAVGGNPNPKLYALTPDGIKKWETDLGPFPGGLPAVAASVGRSVSSHG